MILRRVITDIISQLIGFFLFGLLKSKIMFSIFLALRGELAQFLALKSLIMLSNFIIIAQIFHFKNVKTSFQKLNLTNIGIMTDFQICSWSVASFLNFLTIEVSNWMNEAPFETINSLELMTSTITQDMHFLRRNLVHSWLAYSCLKLESLIPAESTKCESVEASIIMDTGVLV